MFDSALSSVVESESTVDTPVARNVIFEIEFLLAVHLALVLAVTVFLLT
jgi:hypothetical protein